MGTSTGDNSLLLRRVTRHVKDQNWFAVGLDFLIVVIGVFIGLQAANWNEARTDALREKEILADLLEDLQADQGSLSSSLQLATLGIDAGNMLLMGAGFEPVQSVSFPGQSSAFISNVIEVELPSQPTEAIRGELWKHATIRLYPSHNDATIESLIAAGNSSIIKNESLVQDLLRYRTAWTGVEAAQVNTFRPFRDRVIFAGQEHGFSPLTPVELETVADALSTDPALRGALRTMVEYTIAQQGFYDRMQQQSEALATRVEAELEQ